MACFYFYFLGMKGSGSNKNLYHVQCLIAEYSLGMFLRKGLDRHLES